MFSVKDIKNILSNINIKEDYILIYSNLLIFFNNDIIKFDALGSKLAKTTKQSDRFE